MYHTQSGNSTMFSMGNGYRGYDEGELYSSASVDCTLSLGTPSTRGTNDDSNHHERKRSSCMSNFGWNILPSKNTTAPPSKPHRNANSSSAGDPLLARRCANCDTTSTPLWRNGPRGPKSLCNACGIRYKKEERRATAAAASSSGASSANAGYSETQYMMNGSWAPAPSQKGHACYSSGYSSEYQAMEDDAADYSEMGGGGGGAFMSWRFNLTDRPSFVHDFTR